MTSFKNLDELRKINTTEMEHILKEFIKLYKNTRVSTTSIWVCGRDDKFGYRPAFKKFYLDALVKDLLRKTREGYIVVVPLVFYACKKDNIDKVESIIKGNSTSDFMVYNHYNILVVREESSKKSLIIERYEPANVKYQKDLHSKLQTLFSSTFIEFGKTVKLELVMEKGLQHKYQDKTLCGYHILFWVLYRLSNGIEASREIFESPSAIDKFEQFCICMSKNQTSCMSLFT
jgi:hypothetical protein